MTTTAIVNPAEWMPVVRDLLTANWAETGFDFEFAPDVAAYARLADAGLAFAVGAFDGGQVVGYCTVIVSPHLHNPTILVAGNDALFVAPAYRRGLTTAKIIRAAEAEAKRRGAIRFLWHCRYGTPLADTLEHHGYEPVDTTVMRSL